VAAAARLAKLGRYEEAYAHHVRLLDVTQERMTRRASAKYFLLKAEHGLDLPRRLQVEFSHVVQRRTDTEGGERNYLDDLNPDSKRVIRAWVEPALASAPPEARYQFERNGYFVADLADHGSGHPVYNRAATLKDSWGRAGA